MSLKMHTCRSEKSKFSPGSMPPNPLPISILGLPCLLVYLSLFLLLSLRVRHTIPVIPAVTRSPAMLPAVTATSAGLTAWELGFPVPWVTPQNPTLTLWAREAPMTVASMHLSTCQVPTLKEPNLAAALQEPPINLCMALLPTAGYRSCLERQERVVAESLRPSLHLQIKARTIAPAHSPLLDQPMSTTSNQGIVFNKGIYNITKYSCLKQILFFWTFY